MSPIFKVSKFDTRICVVSDTPYPSPSNIGHKASIQCKSQTHKIAVGDFNEDKNNILRWPANLGNYINVLID